MKNEFLKNNYETTGNDYGQFEEEVRYMDAHTHFIKANGGDIKLWHLLEIPSDKEYIGELLSVRSFSGNTSYEQDVCALETKKENICLLSAFPVDEAYLAEIASDSIHNKTLVEINGEFYFTGPNFISALAATIGLGGDLMKVPSYERNNLIAYGLSRLERRTITLSYRECNGIKKLMDARSEKYERIFQKVILDIVHFLTTEGMGTIQCRKWYMSHEYTKLQITFPSIAPDFSEFHQVKDCKMIPGLEIITSDVGQNSLMIRGIWDINGAISTYDEVIKRHYGNSDDDTVTKIMEQVRKKIFAQYLQFPKQIIALADLDITSDKNSKELNTKRVFNAIKKASIACELKKVLGKKRERQIVNMLMESFDCEEIVTGYDIAIAFLEIPGKVKFKKEESKLANMIAASVKNVIFADFKDLSEYDYEDNEQLSFSF